MPTSHKAQCGPYIGMPTLRELFPTKTKETIWRWNGERGGKHRLPPSDIDYGQRDPAWTVETIMEWAERTGLVKEMDQVALLRFVGTDS